MKKSPTMAKKPRKAGSGRPVTINGTHRVAVRLSPVLYADFEQLRRSARVEGRELTQSEALRLAVRALVDSPADMVAGMIAGVDQVAVVERERRSSRLATDGGRGR